MRTQIKPELAVRVRFGLVAAVSLMLISCCETRGQGTLNFNAWVGLSSLYYEEQGMWFQVVIPPGTSGRDDMGVTYGADNTPGNGTPFLRWFRQYNPSSYVHLHLTSGATFGLTSVQLADPHNPSPGAVSIAFVGHLASGLALTNTITTPGPGPSTFATYAFSPAFSSGLTSVDILAPRWAMDNLVWVVPEPASAWMFVLGLTVLAVLQRRRRR